ncbi:CBO0543 family protein [Metabacillus endolithicus]
MDQQQMEAYEKINSLMKDVTDLRVEYWHQYSNFQSWQFWVIFLLMFLTPLLVLYFVIDRKKMFLLGFYGFNINVWFGIVDTWGNKQGLWGYPYELTPYVPGNLSLDTALVPVLFILVYQWTLNHNKNFYLYTIVLALFLSFICKPILVMHNFFLLHKWANYFYLFIGYCLIFLFSKLITNIFLKMSKNTSSYY